MNLNRVDNFTNNSNTKQTNTHYDPLVQNLNMLTWEKISISKINRFNLTTKTERLQQFEDHVRESSHNFFPGPRFWSAAVIVLFLCVCSCSRSTCETINHQGLTFSGKTTTKTLVMCCKSISKTRVIGRSYCQKQKSCISIMTIKNKFAQIS